MSSMTNKINPTAWTDHRHSPVFSDTCQVGKLMSQLGVEMARD